MHRLNELAAKLTPAQVREVEDFAEFLITHGTSATTTAAADEQSKVRFDGWAGCLAHVDPQKSDKQFVREAWDEIIDKYD